MICIISDAQRIPTKQSKAQEAHAEWEGEGCGKQRVQVTVRRGQIFAARNPLPPTQTPKKFRTLNQENQKLTYSRHNDKEGVCNSGLKMRHKVLGTEEESVYLLYHGTPTVPFFHPASRIAYPGLSQAGLVELFSRPSQRAHILIFEGFL